MHRIFGRSRGSASRKPTLALATALCLAAAIPASGLARASRSPTLRFASETAKLTAGDGVAGDVFAWQVAVSGNTAIAGAPGHNGSAGAVYVFLRGQSGWTQEAELTASDGVSGDCFGYRVAVDVTKAGTTAVVGAPCRNSYQGAAYVFFQPSGTNTWSQQGELTAPDGSHNDSFGNGVAVNGANALIGAFGKNGNAGAAYVFHRSRSLVWTNTAELTASDGASGDGFGFQLSIAGSYALIGATGHASGTGAAYVFVNGSGGWSQQAELVGSDSVPGDGFSGNQGVAISGSTAIVGANGHNSGTGAAYIFARSGSVWTQEAELTAADSQPGDAFGWSTGISGATAVVGAPSHNSNTGSAYVFHRSRKTGLWAQTNELQASDGTPGDDLGYSARVDGTVAVVGAPFQNGNTGAGYDFTTN